MKEVDKESQKSNNVRIMKENQKNYVDGYITALIESFDFNMVEPLQKYDSGYYVQIEANDGNPAYSLVEGLDKKINDMLENREIPYGAYIDIEIIIRPRKGGEECGK